MYNPYWELIGIQQLEGFEGKTTLKLPISNRISQYPNRFHNGSIVSLLDAAMGMAIRTYFVKEKNQVTVELNIKYLKPATGMYLIAKGSVVEYGHPISVSHGEVLDDNNELIAVGLGTFKQI